MFGNVGALLWFYQRGIMMVRMCPAVPFEQQDSGVEKREVDCGFTSEIIADDYFAKHKLVQ